MRGVMAVGAALAVAACVSVPPTGPAPTPPATPPVVEAPNRQEIDARFTAELLAGWRAPTAAERSGAPGQASAQGDFDADGISDRAELLVNTATDEYAVFVFGAGAAPQRVIVGSPLSEVRTVGLTGGAVLEVELAGARYSLRWNGQRYVLAAAA